MKQLKSLLVRLLTFIGRILNFLIARPLKWTFGLLGRIVSPFWVWLIRPVLAAIFWLIRKLFKWIILIVLVATAIFSSRLLPPNYDKARPVTLTEAKLPPLQTVKPIPEGGLDIRPEAGIVQVAVELKKDLGPDDLDQIAVDVVELYRWGRTYFGPFKCGPNYEPNMCVIGMVKIEILVVQEDERFGPDGTVTVEEYLKLLHYELDQTYIDQLLENPPSTLDDLSAFQDRVAAETTPTRGGKPTGGYAQVLDPPEPFEGFK